MLIRLCSKSLELGFNTMWTKNFQMYNLCLEKAEEPDIKLPTFIGSKRKQGNSRKNVYFCFIDYAKDFVWVTTNCGKFWKRREYQTTLPASWETCMQVRKQQLEPDIEQWTGSKLGMEYIRLYIVTLLI